jgi:hypothetical protein
MAGDAEMAKETKGGDEIAETLEQTPNVGDSDQERWNGSRTNILRFVTVNTSFLIMGMHDACIGALIPYVC